MTRNHNLATAQKLSLVCARCGDLKQASAFGMQALGCGDLIRSDTCAACVVRINTAREGIRRTERAAAAVRNKHNKINVRAARGRLLNPFPFVATNGPDAGKQPGTCVYAMAA